jgi:hypothetical protein
VGVSVAAIAGVEDVPVSGASALLLFAPGAAASMAVADGSW